MIENEPVAWISKHGVVYTLDSKDEVHPINELQPLYTAPQKPKWQSFTDMDMEFVERFEDEKHASGFKAGFLWAERVLMEKNK